VQSVGELVDKDVVAHEKVGIMEPEGILKASMTLERTAKTRRSEKKSEETFSRNFFFRDFW